MKKLVKSLKKLAKQVLSFLNSVASKVILTFTRTSPSPLEKNAAKATKALLKKYPKQIAKAHKQLSAAAKKGKKKTTKKATKRK